MIEAIGKFFVALVIIALIVFGCIGYTIENKYLNIRYDKILLSMPNATEKTPEKDRFNRVGLNGQFNLEDKIQEDFSSHYQIAVKHVTGYSSGKLELYMSAADKTKILIDHGEEQLQRRINHLFIEMFPDRYIHLEEDGFNPVR